MTSHIGNRQMTSLLCGSIDGFYKGVVGKQANGLSPVWVMQCFFMSLLSVKTLSHLEQANGLPHVNPLMNLHIVTLFEGLTSVSLLMKKCGVDFHLFWDLFHTINIILGPIPQFQYFIVDLLHSLKNGQKKCQLLWDYFNL